MSQISLPLTSAELRQRQVGLFALFLVSAFNYIDRTILSILQIPIKNELGLSDGQLGALTGFAFALFYATLSLPIARLADRYSRRWLIVVCLTLWSAMTVMCGFAVGFISLAFFRIGVAIGEAGGVPASVSLIADYYPPERRASAVSTWGLALPVGLLFGFSATGWLAEAVGWRSTFMIVGGIGVVLAPIVFFLIVEPQRGRFESTPQSMEAPPPLQQSLLLLWRNKPFRFMILGGMLHSFSLNAMINWNAPFYSRTHGLSLSEVATLMALLVGLAGAIGVYLSGVLADRLGMRDPRWRVWVIAVSVGATVPFAFAQYLIPSTTGSIAAAVLTSVLMMAYYGPLVAGIQSVTPTNMCALGQAVLLLTFSLFGLGLGPWLTGMLSDALGATYGTDGLRYALTAASIPSGISAMVLVYAARFFAAGSNADQVITVGAADAQV